MNLITALLLMLCSCALWAQELGWPPQLETPGDERLPVLERKTELYAHGIRDDWGYPAPQQDHFVVVHPKNSRPQAPLYVVLHSAGHDVYKAVHCTTKTGNHDIYHAPDEFFALYLDCRANQGDWWWGGPSTRDAKLMERNSGKEPMPAERRVIDTVKWVMETYGIDPNRVYLCGNSMGGSGALGIGLRHGDLFSAIKANVPAGVEHVAQRMSFPPQTIPEGAALADPPVVIDYSAPNDAWSVGHDRFVAGMKERKYALYFYWGPFGHANNHAKILQVNDLINSFDWLSIKKNEAYAVFTDGSCNDPHPWPDRLADKKPGQINAFFRWENRSDKKRSFKTSLYLTSPDELDTRFAMPETATVDVTLRRLQQFDLEPNETFRWAFGDEKGKGVVDASGLITVSNLTLTSSPTTLTIRRSGWMR